MRNRLAVHPVGPADSLRFFDPGPGPAPGRAHTGPGLDVKPAGLVGEPGPAPGDFEVGPAASGIGIRPGASTVPRGPLTTGSVSARPPRMGLPASRRAWSTGVRRRDRRRRSGGRSLARSARAAPGSRPGEDVVGQVAQPEL